MLLIISLVCAVFFDNITKCALCESCFSLFFMETYISLANFMPYVNRFWVKMIYIMPMVVCC